MFVPTDADPRVLSRLRDLGAEIEICHRSSGDAGDPTYLRLLEDLAAGAVPFTCQGNLNGLVIEGGETLGYEIASDLAAEDEGPLDHVVVQVGGGALGERLHASLRRGFRARRCSPGDARLHTVQTAGDHPLERAYRLVREHLGGESTPAGVEAATATRPGTVRSTCGRGRTSRRASPRESSTTRPTTGSPSSRACCRPVASPSSSSEERLAEAQELGRAAGFRADPTGTASLAGLLDLVSEGVVTPTERAAVLFTGVER